MVKVFKGALKSKVNHLKRLEVKSQGEILTSQGEILTSQGFDRGHRSTYSACNCDTPLYNCIIAVDICPHSSQPVFFTGSHQAYLTGCPGPCS